VAEVELQDVTKRYGAVTACSGVNLCVVDGEFVTLLGPSGCGKSTTLNVIAGLEEISEGEIRMDGRRVNDLTPYERDVAMVFQQYALYPHMTVAENIGFTMKLRRRPRTEIAARVGAVANMLELAPYLDRLPRELSGGQQQRVALGRAIVREPRVFLFDEPFSNLDAALRLKMRAEVKLLHSRLGVTSIFVTHDQEEALSISDRIAVMREGRVEQYGTPEEIYARPATTYVARFIGSPPMDILQGAILAENGEAVYRVGAASFLLPERLAADLVGLAEGGIDLGVRAEHIQLVSPRDGVAATVQVVQPLGPSTVVTAGWEGGALTARVPGIAGPTPGEPIGLRLDPAGMLFFDRGSGQRLQTRGL
jgi:ABC-type sugar transport system ATPase subunit